MAIAFVAAFLGAACATKAVPPRDSRSASKDVDAGDDAGDEIASGDDDDASTTRGADAAAPALAAKPGPCPPDMALVETASPARRFCIDRYEASLLELHEGGAEEPFPHYLPVDGHVVRAVSRPGVFPQGYISEVQAQDACGASGKRLCVMDEWRAACMGEAHTTFPYGDARRPGACHDTGKSAVVAVFGAKAVAASTPMTPMSTAAPPAKPAHVTKGRAAQASKPRARTAKPSAKAAGKKVVRRPAATSRRPSSVDPGVWAKLNDPALGQVDGALAKTGDHAECVNGFGVFDMVGNLHEWIATDPAIVHGTFAGGYYLDTTLNGDGCLYKTEAHAHDYHDYSTGFRCCAVAE